MLTDSKSHKILIVEDELFTQKLIREIITNLGNNCEAASSVSEALSLVKTFSPELIITDLDLGPGPTGIDLINKVDKDKNKTCNTRANKRNFRSDRLILQC